MKKDSKAKDELMGLSPFLSELKSKAPKQEVPRNFFEQLPDDVMQRIKLEDQHLAAERSVDQPSWFSWLLPKWQPRYALAFATVLILIVAGIFSIRPTGQQETLLADTELSTEDWESYVSQNIDDFDSELLWQASESDKTSSEVPSGESDDVLDDLLEDINEEDLEDFFM